VNLLKKLFILAILSGGLLYALSNASGVLRSGNEVILTPQDGHSLNVVRMSGSDANFDITMSNKGKVYYSATSQIDDIYLVFHNDVVEGDRIKIHVNSGSFRYNISPVKSLPSMVKKALYKKATDNKKSKHKKRVVKKKSKIKKSKPAILGEFVEDVTKSKTIKEKEHTYKAPVIESKPTPTVVPEPTPAIVKETTPKNSIKNDKKVLSDSFYDNFTKIFKNLVKSFSSKSNSNIKPVGKKTILKEEKLKDDKPEPIKPIKEVKEKLDDRAMTHEATMIRGDFSKLPSEIEIFDDSELQKSAKIEKKVFKPIKKAPKIAPVATPIEVTPKKEVVLEPTNVEQTTTTLDPIINQTTPQKVIVKQEQEVKVAPTKESIDESLENRVIKKPTSSYENSGYYPDTGYKDEYKDLNGDKKVVKEAPKPELVDNSGEKKIVITKIIDKEKDSQESSDPFAGRVLGKIDDRILGGGYNPDEGTSKFGMKVTKNSKPVSAWIEVFKNGTKDRVKTFYTLSSSKVKKVKLPAGVYMIRATYRSKAGKLQKTLKNISLSEGEDITKHITFHDGKLRVIARRDDKSLYVKVTAYKSGTKDRVAFEFSDRHSGITNMTLGTGTYDIEVAEHNKIREFNGIKIRSGKIETIKADF
jgi:hypothetical protein